MGAYLDNNELYLFNEGKNAYAYRSLGCHRVLMDDGAEMYRFAVWAPNAVAVSVVGSFNNWEPERTVMTRIGTTGVWQAHTNAAREWDMYKFSITTRDGDVILKADPFAFSAELRPGTASVICDIEGFEFTDETHMRARLERDPYNSPMSIYEVHLPSWRQGLDFDGLARELIPYVVEMGYTHIELMPVSEYPLDDSWGYQVTGYFAITKRLGAPKDFMNFVNACHNAGISIILDWVPAHFARDAFGLRRFDGTPLFEHPDPRRSDQPQWGTTMFDYGKSEVKGFLISNAVYFFREYHIDMLRVDAVSCMLYLDYGKSDGDWLPNVHGGRENLEAMDFLRELSTVIGRECEGAQLCAEESTAFPLVTKPPECGGLGFNFKWNMGFMNDILEYFSLDSFYRKFHHDKLTFSMCYAFSENYVLPFSHDEVVHMKNSLIGRMPGEHDEKLRQLKLLYMYQYAHPGKKLLFMGGELGQFREWAFRESIDWGILGDRRHAALREFVASLNATYKSRRELYEADTGWNGFEWRVVDDSEHSVAAFVRRDADGNELLCVFNFTPVDHTPYSMKLPNPVRGKIVFSSVGVREDEYETRVSMEDDVEINRFDVNLYGYEAAYIELSKKPAR